jgi:hypothetical protein
MRGFGAILGLGSLALGFGSSSADQRFDAVVRYPRRRHPDPIISAILFGDAPVRGGAPIGAEPLSKRAKRRARGRAKAARRCA